MRRRHQRGMGAADRDLGKFDFAADEPLRRRGHDIAGVDVDLRAQPLQRHQQQVDRPRADRAAAGQRHARFAHSRQQRRDHPEARAHARNEFVGRGGVDDRLGAQMRGLAGGSLFARPLAVDRTVDAMIAEDAARVG